MPLQMGEAEKEGGGNAVGVSFNYGPISLKLVLIGPKVGTCVNFSSLPSERLGLRTWSPISNLNLPILNNRKML